MLLAASLGVSGQSYRNLIPVPESVQPAAGELVVTRDFTIAVTGNPADFVLDRTDDFLRRLAGRTGIFIGQERIIAGHKNPDNPVMVVHVDEPGELKLGADESYRLEVTGSGIRLEAPTSYGAIHGLETLLQWLDHNNQNYFFPAVVIRDMPRFPWRGLLIDPARHWLPVDVIKRNLDGMSAVKMNVLHLHLTEDQGFRIESKAYPLLHELGGEGDYYTQEQMKDIIRYAADRGIRVVPEFDIPGHATSWLVGYPELATLKESYRIEREWGVMDPVLDPSSEYTYAFLDTFLTEMARLFPDEYMHIGGDENNGKHWNAASHIDSFKNAHNLKDNHELQAWFNRRIHQILSKNDKKMAGWDEIQHPDIPKHVVIQSWRGPEGLKAAARAGYPVMLSNGYYIDLIQPASFHYLTDPLPEGHGLSAVEQQLVLGGEATMWGEQVTWETIDSRIWPRTAAIAERLWSRADIRDVPDMYRRLDVISLQLEELGLTHEKNYDMMLRRLTRSQDVAALRMLTDVCEPVKIYARNALSDVNALSPYTRFVDAARPDAPVARRFNELATQLQTGSPDADFNNLKDQLQAWYQNSHSLSLILDANPVLHEVKPLAQALRDLSFIGLQAAAYVQNGQPAPESWKAFALEICQKAAKPHGEAELMIVEGIKQLILATR